MAACSVPCVLRRVSPRIGDRRFPLSLICITTSPTKVETVCKVIRPRLYETKKTYRMNPLGALLPPANHFAIGFDESVGKVG
jgi:hypothetical protein